MGAELVKDMKRIPCHDCGAKVGKHHQPGCDTERCPKCSLQLISCDCFVKYDENDDDADSKFDEKEFSKYEQEVWSGIMYEEAMLYAEQHNLFCYDENGKFHIKCDVNHPKAHHDINSAVSKMYHTFKPQYKKTKNKK